MRQIANFTIEDSPIARGGMGQIFRGFDSQGNVVAIKEILPEFATDWSIRTRIEKEVEFLHFLMSIPKITISLWKWLRG